MPHIVAELLVACCCDDSPELNMLGEENGMLA